MLVRFHFVSKGALFELFEFPVAHTRVVELHPGVCLSLDPIRVALFLINAPVRVDVRPVVAGIGRARVHIDAN